ncbi:MAG: hypothetical protein MJB14_22495 [Spirochaetes bacterium]|nr:hypothetical protein [Spirochaetota bacterium]
MDNELTILKKIFKKAYQLYKANLYFESFELIRNTSEIWLEFPQKVRFLNLLGLNFIQLNNLEEAERVLMEAFAIAPEDHRILDTLGELFLKTEDFKKAEKAFLVARKLDFFNFKYTIKSAKAALLSGNYRRMFRRLKEGYIPEIIDSKQEEVLKKLLSDILHNEKIVHRYKMVKNFRSFCYDRKYKRKERFTLGF